MMRKWANRWFHRNGWGFMGTLPKRKAKVVLVIGPHSSHKDYWLMLACLSLTKMEVKMLIDTKDWKWSLFPLLYSLHGKKIERNQPEKTLLACLAEMNASETACFGLMTNTIGEPFVNSSPLFYQLAYQSKASVVLVGIDHHRKLVKFHNPFFLSGNETRDLNYIQGIYANFFSYARSKNGFER